uniref:TNFR-Cys domain-containing protein n=1 Tax=Leptobrachium leishanense TaxID=445787 RepID=A0A8C5ML38_9ANUR
MAVTCVIFFVLWFTALSPTMALCPPHQYPQRTESGTEICCFYCAAGEQIVASCKRHDSKSNCAPCKKGYFNKENTRSFCTPCYNCDASSIEKKPCEKHSAAICECPEGSVPNNERNTSCRCEIGKQIVEKKCVPCPTGHFSNRENSICQPWTNCSARGEEVQQSGSRTSDVKCSKTKIPPEAVTTKYMKLQTTGIILNNLKTNTENQQITTRAGPKILTKNDDISNGNTSPNNVMNLGTLLLILVGVLLLSVSAGFIITLMAQTKPKKNRRLYTRKCKHPVQEVQEQSSASESSLVKQCSA